MKLIAIWANARGDHPDAEVLHCAPVRSISRSYVLFGKVGNALLPSGSRTCYRAVPEWETLSFVDFPQQQLCSTYPISEEMDEI